MATPPNGPINFSYQIPAYLQVRTEESRDRLAPHSYTYPAAPSLVPRTPYIYPVAQPQTQSGGHLRELLEARVRVRRALANQQNLPPAAPPPAAAAPRKHPAPAPRKTPLQFHEISYKAGKPIKFHMEEMEDPQVHPESLESIALGIVCLQRQDYTGAAMAFENSYSRDPGVLNGALFDPFNKFHKENTLPLPFAQVGPIGGHPLLLLRGMFFFVQHRYEEAKNDLKIICDPNSNPCLAKTLLRICECFITRKEDFEIHSQNLAALASLSVQMETPGLNTLAALSQQMDVAPDNEDTSSAYGSGIGALPTLQQAMEATTESEDTGS